MNTDKAKKLVKQLISGLQELDAVLNEDQGVQTLQALEEDLGSFELLKKALESDRWPEAVNSALICDPTNHSNKTQRARGIIDLTIEEDLTGLKFLDFGCGEGHTTLYAAEKGAAVSVGYDHDNPAWKDFVGMPNLLLTSNWEEISATGPYDIIMLFDVLDHLTNEDPVTVLKRLGSLLKENGKIYVRCHPFSSRHATHLYHDLNKAYVHLVFTPQELKEIVPNPRFAERNIGVTMPVATYSAWFEKAGLKVVNRVDFKENVEPFFKIPKIAERIMRISKYTNFPEFQMSIQFINFILAKKDVEAPQTAGPEKT
jgi:2-polyprenyl-3-methyl-5-hydroxy-6-metoxy-1,4-benzoquinol methylase